MIVAVAKEEEQMVEMVKIVKTNIPNYITLICGIQICRPQFSKSTPANDQALRTPLPSRDDQTAYEERTREIHERLGGIVNGTRVAIAILAMDNVVLKIAPDVPYGICIWLDPKVPGIDQPAVLDDILRQIERAAQSVIVTK